MNSPPEALSPSPSTPSSGSPSPDDIVNTQPTIVTPTHVTNSPSQAKRRLPPSSSSAFGATREGRENKSRRRERDVLDRRSGAWDTGRSTGEGHGSIPGGGRMTMREDLVDMHKVEYVRNMYGDPFDDEILAERNKTL